MKLNFVDKTEESRTNLSRCQRSILKQAITELPREERCNRNAIVESVADLLEKRYSKGDEKAMDKQLRRIGVNTTRDISNMVDNYIVTHVNVLDK